MNTVMRVPGHHRVSRAQAHRAAALQLLRRHHRLSRTEIARRSGLSEPSVSRTIRLLMRQRLVVPDGAARPSGGRPAIPLRLDDGLHRSIGVDIHGWATQISVGTLSGRILESLHFRTPASPAKTLDRIAASVLALSGQLVDRELIGVGVSARGLVNSRTGVVERGNDPAWTRIAVRQILEQRLGLPVFVENNVRAAALAEYHYGSPDVQDSRCLLFVKVDEGVGISMILDGELYCGQHMAAGEFGQMVIAAADTAATHDRPGCLETLASNEALCQRFRARGGRGRRAGGDCGAQAHQICQAAMAGDRAAVEALRETARYLGIGISNAIWGLDPDAVIVDGAIAEAWPLVAPLIQAHFADGQEFLNFRNLILRPSALRGAAAIVGAAALPFQSVFAAGEHEFQGRAASEASPAHLSC